MSVNQRNNTRQDQEEITIDFRDLFSLCVRKWIWFVISLALTLCVAVFYILRTPSAYTRTATVLIKEDSKGKSVSSDLGAFSDLGLFQSSSNVNNEVISFQSPAVMTEVVKRLNLDMNYYLPGRFHRVVAYGLNLPVNARIVDFPDNEVASFTLEVGADSTVVLSEITYTAEGEKLEAEDVEGRLLEPIFTPMGLVVITPTLNFQAGEPYTIYVHKSGLYGMVNAYSNALQVGLRDEKSTAISLTIEDQSIRRAEDVLNTLITIYNENWVSDKNQIAVSTSMFIDERLRVIEKELGNVDEDISTYKSENLLPDVQAASSMYMTQSNATAMQILELNNQLYMTRYIRTYLTSETNRNQLLPANSGIGSNSIESQISEYNKQLLQRNNLVANSSTENPLILDMDKALDAMREAIVKSVDNQIETLGAQIKSLRDKEQETTSQIAASPTQAKYLLSVERQQKVKESLYLYLLQKREENELSQAFTAYNTRIITPPYGSSIPTSPSRRNILMIAIVLGLLIPMGVIFVGEFMNTRIRGRKDLENLSVPLIGEIPQYQVGKKRLIRIKRKAPDIRTIVVKEGSRDIINEAFRVLRTNLEFMTGKDKSSNVIVMTSFNIGAGKSFLSMNLAAILAIKGRSVLVIDGDLRSGVASSYIGSPKRGLSDYLAGRTDKLEDIIVVDRPHVNMSVIPRGAVVPNPTELLSDGRLSRLIDAVRGKYDYVLIDCPPVEIVADTQIIGELADRIIFVVRAGLFEKSMLGELENIYNEKKYKNMSLILNGTESSGGGRYGYRYGYHYGYGYGYDSDTNRGG